MHLAEVARNTYASFQSFGRAIDQIGDTSQIIDRTRRFLRRRLNFIDHGVSPQFDCAAFFGERGNFEERRRNDKLKLTMALILRKKRSIFRDKAEGVPFSDASLALWRDDRFDDAGM